MRCPAPGNTIYAGKGDGTFETTPFYTVPLPQHPYVSSFATGDVNGDGNPDLLLVQTSNALPYLVVYLGDGHGNFTPDTNTYFVSTVSSSYGPNAPVPRPAQQPGSSSRQRPQAGSVNYSHQQQSRGFQHLSRLPVKPDQSSFHEADPHHECNDTAGFPAGGSSWKRTTTLGVFVFGANPTGCVSFSANGSGLGTEAVARTEPQQLQTSSREPVSTPSRQHTPGDGDNTANTSNAVVVTIGQETTTTLQVSPNAGDVNKQITLKEAVTGSGPTGTVSSPPVRRTSEQQTLPAE